MFESLLKVQKSLLVKIEELTKEHGRKSDQLTLCWSCHGNIEQVNIKTLKTSMTMCEKNLPEFEIFKKYSEKVRKEFKEMTEDDFFNTERQRFLLDIQQILNNRQKILLIQKSTKATEYLEKELADIN